MEGKLWTITVRKPKGVLCEGSTCRDAGEVGHVNSDDRIRIQRSEGGQGRVKGMQLWWVYVGGCQIVLQ